MVELVELDFPTLDFLIMVVQLCHACMLLLPNVLQFRLSLKHYILEATQLILRIPPSSLPLPFGLLDFLQFILLGCNLGLQLPVTDCHVICLCLQLPTTDSLRLNHSLHSIYLLPTLCDSVLDLLGLLA